MDTEHGWLKALLEEHIRGEAQAIQEYQKLASRADMGTAMLLSLIIHDEEYHHRLMTGILAGLEGRDTPADWSIPLPGEAGGQAPAEARRIAGRLYDFAMEEAATQRYLKSMTQNVGATRHGLYALLLEIMARDSRKHERILKYLAGRLAPDAGYDEARDSWVREGLPVQP